MTLGKLVFSRRSNLLTSAKARVNMETSYDLDGANVCVRTRGRALTDASIFFKVIVVGVSLSANRSNLVQHPSAYPTFRLTTHAIGLCVVAFLIRYIRGFSCAWWINLHEIGMSPWRSRAHMEQRSGSLDYELQCERPTGGYRASPTGNKWPPRRSHLGRYTTAARPDYRARAAIPRPLSRRVGGAGTRGNGSGWRYRLPG